MTSVRTSENSCYLCAMTIMFRKQLVHLQPTAPRRGVEEFCKRQGYQFDESVLDRTPTFKALKELRSTHKLGKFCDESLVFVEPKTVDLGKNKQGVTQSYQYAPVLKQIQALVIQGIVNFRGNEGESRGELAGRLYSDFSDGYLHRQLDSKLIKVILYYDDFGVVNPLGNRARENKISAVYFSLGNFPSQERSRVERIYLALLFRSAYAKVYGLCKIFQPLVQDLAQLENVGIDICVEGKRESVKGSVVFVCADNLAAHSLAGYTCNFSKSRKVCRFCNAAPDTLRKYFKLNKFTLQSREDYDDKVELLKRLNFPKDACKECGIVSVSPLSALVSLHVVDLFPPDIAHDLFEGVCAQGDSGCLGPSYICWEILHRRVLERAY